jgi:2-dehydropantoate 2-reductase
LAAISGILIFPVIYDTLSTMKIAVIGAGGVGGYFGGRLARANFDVTFLARGEHLREIQQNGLRVKSVNGDFVIENAQATDSFRKIGFADIVILAVKAWQVRDISVELAPIIKKDTIVLPLQNGVVTAEELAENIPAANIIGGLCKIISKVESPGVICHFALDPVVIFGEFDSRGTERAELLKSVFDRAEINSVISDDITADLWKKFIAICVSGLLAVTRTSYGELRELKETRQLMTELIREIFLLSQRLKINIEPEFPDNLISLIDTYPYETTSSLTRDVWDGRPSEIEYQNGTVVRLGEKYGVDTPVNRFVYNCILPMEIKARKKGAEITRDQKAVQ